MEKLLKKLKMKKSLKDASLASLGLVYVQIPNCFIKNIDGQWK